MGGVLLELGFWVLGWVGFCWGVLDGEGLRQHVQVGCGAPHFDLEGIGGVGGWGLEGRPGSMHIACPSVRVRLWRLTGS